MKLNELTPEEERVIVHKGTEMPHSGEHDGCFEPGVYVCKRCALSLCRQVPLGLWLAQLRRRDRRRGREVHRRRRHEDRDNVRGV